MNPLVVALPNNSQGPVERREARGERLGERHREGKGEEKIREGEGGNRVARREKERRKKKGDKRIGQNTEDQIRGIKTQKS